MYIASLVLGIVSLLFSWVPFFGFVIAIIALIISIIAMAKKNPKRKNKGMEIAGMVLSIIAVVISFIIVFVVLGAAAYLSKNSDDIINSAQIALESSNKANAKAELTKLFAEVIDVNEDAVYTGYIDRNTLKYTNIFSGIEIEEYYEDKLEQAGYDFDVYVNSQGIPNIEY